MTKYGITRVLSQRNFLAVLIVNVNFFSWYFPLYLFFESTLEKFQVELTFLLVAFGVQCVVAIGFAIIGSALVKRFPSRDEFLSVWMLVGIIASTLMILLETFNMAYIYLVSFILGISLGLGWPSCFAYFGDCSIEENRGRLAGITFFASCLGIFFIGWLLSFSTLVVGALILATWRGIGLLLFLLARSKQDSHKENMIDVSYRSVLHTRSFLLYLFPWIMFCLINWLERPILINFFGKDFASFMPIAEYGIGGFSALAGGWLADAIGRKRVLIFGFMVLAIEYAVLAFFPSIILSWYLHITLDGVAWGILSIMFYLVIWGELAGNRIKEKYYFIGVSPFVISSYIQLLFTPYAKLIDISTAFSLASLFLFLAVLPLLLAPETLPERKIELRRLRKYVEGAKRVQKNM